MQILATNAQARNYYTLGEFTKSLQCLEEVKRGIESYGENNDISDELNYHALMAIFSLRQKKIEQCWKYAETAFNILTIVQPTLCFSFFGYAWLLETYCTFLIDPQYLDDGKIPLSKQKLMAKAEKVSHVTML